MVHEAYLRLVEGERRGSSAPWDNRRHFFAAVEPMRRILVENVRHRKRRKRGGDHERQAMRDVAAPAPDEDLVALDEALELLARKDTAKAELVKLRSFAGLSVEEAAHCLNISRAPADRWWTFARAWLFEKIRAGEQKA